MSEAAAVAGEGVSKNAKRRAAKKARDAAHEEQAAPEPVPPPPPPAPKAKAKAAAAPEPQSQPKAKGKAKAAPAPEPKAEPEPKAKAKGKAKAKAQAEPEPLPTPPPKAKAAAKQQAKAKAKPAAPVEEPEKDVAPKEELVNWTIDDGSGAGWEECSGLTKKQQKKKERDDAEAAAAKLVGGSGRAVPANQQYIVGMGPAPVQQAGKGAPNQSVAADVKRILEAKQAAEEKAKEDANSSTVTITVPDNKIGIVIGPKGKMIKLLQAKSGVTRIDTSGNIFTISGPPSAVAEAHEAIKELMTKGYCSLAYEGFSENIINVHPSAFPDLIGKKGAIVIVIKDKLGVEVNFTDVPKGSPPSKKGKVMLAGTAANVEKAKAVINNILTYKHDELTHPGEVHEEIEIEPWCYRYLIGSKGSEMKHIQHNYKVRVDIPRDTSVNENVLVVGEPSNVARAKAYIERLVWNAENNSKGRDRVDGSGGDQYGDDEEEEPWMKQYMYKR